MVYVTAKDEVETNWGRLGWCGGRLAQMKAWGGGLSSRPSPLWPPREAPFFSAAACGSRAEETLGKIYRINHWVNTFLITVLYVTVIWQEKSPTSSGRWFITMIILNIVRSRLEETSSFKIKLKHVKKFKLHILYVMYNTSAIQYNISVIASFN